ncbi:signal peptidase I [Sediminicurvatus halobius]|uniref:Signal peptidase I n=1 Tax=Sediminicurvatus halobius TaxID=2182432 RepID=A0A2U2N3F3_9GAMM|nr:signal peptidase I [Spiribacter halobius]PWG63761.1 signal peptidase I [Spiribacter halobius]UEX76243.1 signal peptidase I [Spiribacter halobius]
MLDFETLLVVLTGVTGVVWGWDRWRRRRRDPEARVSWWVDLARSLFPVILIVLVVRSFVVEPFRIPSGSMIPTLHIGDFILVNKFSYGLRLPVGHQLLVPLGDPERGDVVVFRYPRDPNQDYVKRIVGVPGDRLRYEGKRLYINGEAVPVEALGSWQGDEGVRLFRERIGDEWHRMLVHRGARDRGFTYEVPEGQYFMMGDNRDRSSDSRIWGPVPRDNLVGEAFLIWMSWNGGINWGRLGDVIE